MGKLIMTINMPDAPKTVLEMMKAPLEQMFKSQMKQKGVDPKNITVEIED